MRVSAPRIPPVDPAHCTEDQAEALKAVSGDRPPLNIFRTMAHAPKALTRFLDWGGYVLSRRNSLSERDREIAILRTGWLCRSGYEFTQHTAIARRAVLTEAEIARIKRGPGAAGWTEAEKALLVACDQLHSDQFIDDAAWAGLARSFDRKQMMDLVFTVGQYTQVSMLLNSFGVQLDEGLTLDPDLAPGGA